MQAKNEKKTTNQIKDELISNEPIIPKADKRKSIICMYKDEYNQKIMNFISNNKFTVANSDITKNIQRDLRNTIDDCQQIINKDNGWKYINVYPTNPMLRGVIKIRTDNTPIRPVVNWKNAPTYKLTKLISENIKTYIPPQRI